MKDRKKIHHLDALDLEISRLKLEARSIGQKLDHNTGYLRRNYLPMLLNTFTGRSKEKEKSNTSLFDLLSGNETFAATVNKVTSHITGRVAGEVCHLVERLLEKTK